MSIQIMSKVYFVNLPTNEKFVLLILADHCDIRGVCWPSQERLARYTSLSVRTVSRCIKQLLEDDWLTVLRKSKGTGISTKYQLNLKRIVEVPEAVSGTIQSTGHPDQSTGQTRQKYPTQLHVNHKEPPRTVAPSQSDDNSKALAIKSLREHLERQRRRQA